MCKEINIPFAKNLIVEKSKIINLFDSFFSDDFSFDFSDKNIDIQLIALDYNLFYHSANRFLNKGFLKPFVN